MGRVINLGNELFLKKTAASRGFTLPEMLVTLCLLALLFPVLLRCFQTLAEQQRQRAALLELEDNLLMAVEILTREIAGSTAVLSCEENRLVLQQDSVIYYDIGDDLQMEDHLYPMEGKILYRREDSQSARQPMANFVETLTFFYLDEAGQPTDEAALTRAVGFSLTGVWRETQLQCRQVIRLAGAVYL